jgi:uncharacterized protein
MNQQFNEILNALEKPETYPHDVSEIKKITTAVSVVFLTGKYAYKINKPLNLGFLDFSTLEKRQKQCEDEIKYNSLISPELYHDTIKITLTDGKIKVDADGEIIEHGIKMEQVDPESTMNNLLTSGEIIDEHVTELATKIFNFHQVAICNEEVNEYGSVASIKFNWDENFEQTQKYKEQIISENDFQFIKDKINLFIGDNTTLLESRVKENKIKHCHGDFHSGNVFITNDDILIFDGIVFNKRFPCSDVIAEIAFMAMDLEFHHQENLAKNFISNYKELSQDKDIDKLLNFYKCYRAYIRAKINCFTYDDENLSQEEKDKTLNLAKKYFKLAKKYSESL